MVRLVNPAEIPIRRYVKVKSDANPFGLHWRGYFEARGRPADLRLSRKGAESGQRRFDRSLLGGGSDDQLQGSKRAEWGDGVVEQLAEYTRPCAVRTRTDALRLLPRSLVRGPGRWWAVGRRRVVPRSAVQRKMQRFLTI